MNIGLLETILICMKCFFGIPDNIPYFQLLYPPKKRFSLPHTLSFENYCQKSGGISNKPNIFNPRKSWVFFIWNQNVRTCQLQFYPFLQLTFQNFKIIKKSTCVKKGERNQKKLQTVWYLEILAEPLLTIIVDAPRNQWSWVHAKVRAPKCQI